MQTFIELDVAYHEDMNTAQAAAVMFSDIRASQASHVYQHTIHHIEPYQSGQFYRRELPCLLAILSIIKRNYDCIIIDGNVYLDKQHTAGLGAHLYEALHQTTPIIGVAKTVFASLDHEPYRLLRGMSQNPLIITAIGIPQAKAKQLIAQMHGKYRIPSLLKQVDSLSRQQK